MDLGGHVAQMHQPALLHPVHRWRQGRLPATIVKPLVPPIKCQGIKTKLVSFILSSVQWEGQGVWVEPFFGSGVVGLNVNPRIARVSDINVHIVRFYRDVASGLLNEHSVKEFLNHEGKNLFRSQGEHYYEVRDRFNQSPSSFDFLFLNRSCFNGLMRFNRNGEFNVPFGKKSARFSRAYITKICNQIKRTALVFSNGEWTIDHLDWQDCLSQISASDFVYADPPYLGRHVDYYTGWSEKEDSELLNVLHNLSCKFALSTWKGNRYRENERLKKLPSDWVIRTITHFYHVGASEENRNSVQEALVISPVAAVEEAHDPGAS